MSEEPNESDLDWYQPLGLMRPWMKSAWFRGLVFIVLFTPVVVLVWVGHLSVWFVVTAALGLVQLVYNDALYAAGWVRTTKSEGGNQYEQSDGSKILVRLVGAMLYAFSLIAAIVLYRHH